jgi:hypothetical protein
MILSVMVGNGAQLCAMVGVTLGSLLRLLLNVSGLMDKDSIRSPRVLVSLKPRFPCHCHDDMLDFLWRVKKNFA